MAPILHRFARHAWRGVVLVVGLALIAAGLVMMVTPGPGIAAILAGLALLSTEFAWAKRVLDWVRRRFAAARDEVRRRTTRRSNSPAGEGSEGEVGADGSARDKAVEVAGANDVVAEPRAEGGPDGSARTMGEVVKPASEVPVEGSARTADELVKPLSEVPVEGSARREVQDGAARQSATS
jgi:uncharacterized protein (TIGR02611 family)